MSVSIRRLPVKTSGGSARCRLYLWADGKHSPVEEFIAALAKERPDAFNRLGVLLRKTAETGIIINETQFKDVQGHKPLYEFKPHGVRVYCFFDGRDKLILVAGDSKKTDKSTAQNRAAIVRAEERVRLYWQEKKAGRIEETQ